MRNEFLNLGKATRNECWYPHGGKEVSTTDFSWVVASGTAKLVGKDSSGAPPANAIMLTDVYDDNGPYYSIIAETEWGYIPGKANRSWSWFPYGGKEHGTDNFSWIVVQEGIYTKRFVFSMSAVIHV